MKIIQTSFAGLLIIEPEVLNDDRGYFFESYNHQKFEQAGIGMDFVQDNQSYSKKNVLRGLHFQRPPFAQTKLVRVIAGCIQDVAVDLRKEQPTYGKYFSIELSGENRKQLLIPKGFAHGFLVLTEYVEAIYKCDAFYNRESEAGIIFNDPQLKIQWNVPAEEMIVSEKDLHLPTFGNSPF